MKMFLRICVVWALWAGMVVGSSAEILPQGLPDFAAALGEAEHAGMPSFEMLAKELSPSVVNIAVESEAGAAQDDEEMPIPFFRPRPGQPLRSLGSGFIVTEDGYIATNNHVIADARRIVVRLLDDKTDYPAELIGQDEKTDLALIKINVGRKLPVVVAGDSDELQVGEWVLAIGNQFQLGQSVTAGIVSAKSRRMPTQITGPYDDFIQTDASINPGSSGGPLFNRRGQVVGINTAIFSPGRSQFGGSGFNIGIGFAIPVNLAKTVLNQLQDNGKVTRGLLGVLIQSLDSDLAEALGVASVDGALVADVVPGSPAAAAGFKLKDVILEYNGIMIRSHDDLPLLVANTPVGSKVSVKVRRGGQDIFLAPTIVELIKDIFSEEVLELPKANRLGLIIEDVNKTLAAALKLPTVKGVVVVSVADNSAAATAGLQRGDVIIEMDQRTANTAAEFESQLKKIEAGRVILLVIRRVQGTRILTVRVEEQE